MIFGPEVVLYLAAFGVVAYVLCWWLIDTKCPKCGTGHMHLFYTNPDGLKHYMCDQCDHTEKK